MSEYLWLQKSIKDFTSNSCGCFLHQQSVLPEECDKELHQIHEVTVLRESDLRRREIQVINSEKNIHFHAYVWMYVLLVFLKQAMGANVSFLTVPILPPADTWTSPSLSPYTHMINRKGHLYSCRLSILIQIINNHIICIFWHNYATNGPPITKRWKRATAFHTRLNPEQPSLLKSD